MDEREALRALKSGSEEALSWFIERYAAYAAAIINSIVLPRSRRTTRRRRSATFSSRSGAAPGGWSPGTSAAISPPSPAAARWTPCGAHKAALPLNEDVLVLDAPGLDEILTERELRERTRRAVDSMPEPDREIFWRRYYRCQSVDEIARALDMNVNTVKTRLRRGRERLRRTLTKGMRTMEVKITELMGALDPPPEDAYPAPDTERLREAVLRKLGSHAAPQAMRRRGVRRTLLIAAVAAAALSITALAAAGGFGWLRGRDTAGLHRRRRAGGGTRLRRRHRDRAHSRSALRRAGCALRLPRRRLRPRPRPDGAEIRAAKLSGGSGRISHSIKSAPALYDAASGRLLYEFHVSTSEEQWRDGLTLTIADILYNERELDVRCDGLDLASAAEEDGIHTEIPGLEGAYVEFVRLTGGALKVGISRDMAAGEEYSFRPYLLSADGSRYEAASGVRGITPLDPLRRPRGWDEGETSATLVYTIPAPGAEELGGCTLCLRVVCRDALRGTWEIPVELSEGRGSPSSSAPTYATGISSMRTCI